MVVFFFFEFILASNVQLFLCALWFSFSLLDLQLIAHGQQVFPRVKEQCASKDLFANEDINSLEELVGRLRRLKENVGFIANRVSAIQQGLDSWQAEQINRKLYYLSFLSIIFLPLSVITGGQTFIQTLIFLVCSAIKIWCTIIFVYSST